MNHKREDLKYMEKAFELAEQGLFTTGENPRVGCVLVKDGRIIGQGFHLKPGEPHAEVHALQQAGKQAQGSTAYVTLEPCCHHGKTPPCSQALIVAGIKRVVVANTDPNALVGGQGIKQLKEAGIEVTIGVLAELGDDLNAGFFKRMREGLPWVRCKLAQSLDGRTAMASGESYWITGEAARRDVQHWRARSGAIITGVETVLQDDCRLTVRPDDLPDNDKNKPHFFAEQQPLRVIIDSRLRTPLNAKILQQQPVLLVCAGASDEQKNAFREIDCEVKTMPGKDQRVDLAVVLAYLGEQGINEVLVEAGATLAGAFVKANLVDELVIYTAPVLMGASGRPLLDFHIDKMTDRLHIQTISMQAFDQDWRLRATIDYT
ncbi:riboflavin biosynthesis protein RibD [Marinicella pacifica]|uniref:Riboflavin biosynthesis protein RibD n=1 Tax=Marinicella pacifica TaxID=1171543 RepID=A0A917FRB1_9GAMM|nr:bifunctional diaminohydroxyphosphoribosylaminopyrimidine deaminase/5-amino-6-(5-phosphoribosylamino)uracil reductase RibD [Marinicella pacifica]GGF96340.1 riboflavin biosynthesis protein RibD [Marinicella pacifica]